jgi:hypothetical protein
MEEKPAKKARRTGQPADHDPELTARAGMSREAAVVDDEETMASTGDQDNAFQQIAAGTATGLGLDRGEDIGTGGLASEEDRDEVAEGDYWRQLLRRDPFAAPDRSAAHLDEEHRRLGWQTGADMDPRDRSVEYRNRSGERERSEPDEDP